MSRYISAITAFLLGYAAAKLVEHFKSCEQKKHEEELTKHYAAMCPYFVEPKGDHT